MNSDLNLFDENSMSEAEDVNLDCLTHFIISDSVVDNSLRFLLIKFFWNLVAQLICVYNNNQILKEKSMKKLSKIAHTS